MGLGMVGALNRRGVNGQVVCAWRCREPTRG